MKREYDFSKAKRGPVVKPVAGKTRITIRLDNAVLDWFRSQAHKAGGANYQSMVNEALKQHVESTREPIEATLRRVLREELARRSQSSSLPFRTALALGNQSTRRKSRRKV